jgi:hypothetical protein
MKKNVLFLLVGTVIISGCSSYKPRNEGFFKVGYEETMLADGKYKLTYYGSDHDDGEDVKRFWHRRAHELCGEVGYDTENEHAGKWNSGGYVLLPPVVLAGENANDAYSGVVLCRSKQVTSN